MAGNANTSVPTALPASCWRSHSKDELSQHAQSECISEIERTMLRVAYNQAPSSMLAVGGPVSPADVLSIESESTSNDRTWLIILEILSYIDRTFRVFARSKRDDFGERGPLVAFELLKHNGTRSLVNWGRAGIVGTLYSTRKQDWSELASRNDRIGDTYRVGILKLVQVQLVDWSEGIAVMMAAGALKANCPLQGLATILNILAIIRLTGQALPACAPVGEMIGLTGEAEQAAAPKRVETDAMNTAQSGDVAIGKKMMKHGTRSKTSPAPGYNSAITKAKRKWKARKQALRKAEGEARKLQRLLKASQSQLAQEQERLSRIRVELQSTTNDLEAKIQDLTVSLTESNEESQKLQNELAHVNGPLDSERAEAEERTVQALVAVQRFVKAATKQAFEDDLYLPFLEDTFSSAKWFEEVSDLLWPKTREP